MINVITERLPRQNFDMLVGRYRDELQQLNYSKATIRFYLKSIEQVRSRMIEDCVALSELTPDTAVDLVRGAKGRDDRQQYAMFIARQFAGWLVFDSSVTSCRVWRAKGSAWLAKGCGSPGHRGRCGGNCTARKP